MPAKKTTTLEFIVDVSKLDPALKRIIAQMKVLNNNVNKVNGSFRAINPSINHMNTSMNKVNTSTGRFIKQTKGGIRVLGQKGLLGAIALVRNHLLLLSFAFGGVIALLNKTVSASSKLENSLLGVSAVARAVGESVFETKEAAKDLASDGLMTISEAAEGLKNLLARGMNLDQAIKMMNVFKDSAAFGRQGALGFGEAIVGATQGLKNQLSMLLDNAGLTKNLSQIHADYAKSINKTVAQLSEKEKIQAEIIGLEKEGIYFLGNAELLTKTYSGAVAKLSAQFEILKATLGDRLKPIFADVVNIFSTQIEKAKEWMDTHGAFLGEVLRKNFEEIKRNLKEIAPLIGDISITILAIVQDIGKLGEDGGIASFVRGLHGLASIIVLIAMMLAEVSLRMVTLGGLLTSNASPLKHLIDLNPKLREAFQGLKSDIEALNQAQADVLEKGIFTAIADDYKKNAQTLFEMLGGETGEGRSGRSGWKGWRERWPKKAKVPPPKEVVGGGGEGLFGAGIFSSPKVKRQQDKVEQDAIKDMIKRKEEAFKMLEKISTDTANIFAMPYEKERQEIALTKQALIDSLNAKEISWIQYGEAIYQLQRQLGESQRREIVELSQVWQDMGNAIAETVITTNFTIKQEEKDTIDQLKRELDRGAIDQQEFALRAAQAHENATIRIRNAWASLGQNLVSMMSQYMTKIAMDAFVKSQSISMALNAAFNPTSLLFGLGIAAFGLATSAISQSAFKQKSESSYQDISPTGGSESSRRTFGGLGQAPVQNIVITPTVSITGENVWIGGGSVEELELGLEDLIVRMTQKSIDTGELDLSGVGPR